MSIINLEPLLCNFCKKLAYRKLLQNEYKEKKRTIYFIDSSLFIFIKSVQQIKFSSFSYKINNKRVSLFHVHFNIKEINIRKI